MIYIYTHILCVYVYIYTLYVRHICIYDNTDYLYRYDVNMYIHCMVYIYTHYDIYIYMAGVAMYISGTSLCVTSTGEFSSGERLCPDCALLGVEDGGWSLAFSAGLCRCVPSKDCWGDNPWIFRGPQ